jgi:transposase-like protein
LCPGLNIDLSRRPRSGFEVINGAIGRRRWNPDDRARILGETFVPGAVVSEVARRHGLTPQQLFTGRREARKAAETLPALVPAVVALEPAIAAEPSAAPSACFESRRPRGKHSLGVGDRQLLAQAALEHSDQRVVALIRGAAHSVAHDDDEESEVDGT